MIRDCRYALRVLRMNLTTTTIAVLTLAIGVGANAAIFTVIRAVLLRPLPYADADRIVNLSESWPNLSGPRPVSRLNYLDWMAQSSVFKSIAAVTWSDSTLGGEAAPVYVNGLAVSASYFEIFGLHAALGRTFDPDEDQPEHAHVVVLSHRLWLLQFGSDPAILGKSIRLDGQLYAVIGIMPAATSVDLYDPLLWRPLTFDANPPRVVRDLSRVVAKLKMGVSLTVARTQMSGIGDRLAQEYPASNKGYGVLVNPLPRPVGDAFRSSLYLLFAAVGAVLLIGCANLANLALARAVARAHEVAIRAALGASRGQLVRQFLIEYAVIAAVGGGLGLMLGYGLLSVIRGTISSTGLHVAVAPETTISMDAPVWLFAMVLSVLTGMACGLPPAISGTRASLTDALKSGGHGSSTAHRGLRQSLVVAEVALAFVLLTGAGLLIQSFFALTKRIAVGFDSTNVVTAAVPIADARFESGEALNTYLDQMANRIQALPGVRDVAFTIGLPTEGTPYGRLFQIAGQPTVLYGDRPICGMKIVSPSYFRALGIRLLQGRLLSDDDRDGTPLVIVLNQTMVRTYFSHADPLGQRLLMKRSSLHDTVVPPDRAWEVVGVIADEGVSAFNDHVPQAIAYLAREQQPYLGQNVIVRTTLRPERVEESIRKAVATFDPDQALNDMKSLDQLKTEDVAPDQLRSILLSVFAAIAVLLAAMGLYGVLSYSIAQRAREIGIRAALGATKATLIAMVVRQGMILAALGLMFGCVAAFGTARVIRASLVGVAPTDPLMMLLAAAVVASVALMACYIPARRAATVNPLVAMKAE